MAHVLDRPPTIELDGVRLRPLRAADTAQLYTYLRDPEVTALTSYPEVSIALAEGIVERSIHRWSIGDLSKWAVAQSSDDTVVGTCGFNDWSAVHQWAELAYDLAPSHWGKGLMRQAVTAVIRWAFQGQLVNRVQAFVRVDNAPSQGLLERVGFQREGCLRSYRICRGKPYDFYVYGLLRSDFLLV